MSQKITIPILEAAGAYRAAKALAQASGPGKVGIPASLKFYLAGLTRVLGGPHTDLQETEMALVQQYAAKGPDGEILPREQVIDGVAHPIPNSFSVPAEQSERFNAEMDDVHAQSVEIEYTPVSVAQYLPRLDEDKIEIPEGVWETLWPFLADN